MNEHTPSENDWRRRNQEKYLKGRRWSRQTYKPYREGWDHDHCEFCMVKFSLHQSDLQRGYATEDNYYWVCENCFKEFQAVFGWITGQ